MRWRRRPRVAKLARKNDVRRLVAALDYRDHVLDRYGRMYDLGAHVRRDAALALSSANTNGFDVSPSLTRSLGDHAGEVRRAAASALGARREARATIALLEAALTWEEPRYAAARAAATDALLRLSTPETVRLVVRYVIQRAFGRDRVEMIVRGMAARGGQETVREACWTAAAALERGEGATAERAADVLTWLGSDSVEPLLTLLSEPVDARLGAVTALGRIGDLRASHALIERLRDDDDPRVRHAAAVALGDVADPSTAQSLLKATEDPDHAVRAATLEALQKLGPVAALPGPHVPRGGLPPWVEMAAVDVRAPVGATHPGRPGGP
jgi:HEAT repeat protein